jgi:acetate kinase
MKIVVLNSGSSSLKFQVLEMPAAHILCSGLVERIGEEQSIFHYQKEDIKTKEEIKIPNHKVGLELVAQKMMDAKVGVLQSADEISAVGHRVVHGGDAFSDTTQITSEVKKAIKSLFALAPLHNPANYQGIKVAEEVFKNALQIAVFDTAFHQTIPAKAYLYAIPKNFSEQYKIRLYGFHGTSHKYVSEQAIVYLGKKDSKIITIHLGNGCSITAVEKGKSVDHSLGFTPSNGLVMGTRSGDIDHSVIFYLQNKGYTPEQVNNLLNKQSGMLGLTGFNDLRDIIKAAQNGDSNCQLALDMSVYRIKKYIGAYAAVMNGLDAIVFTAGIGENAAYIREAVCANMEFLGIQLNRAANEERFEGINAIESESSKVKILVIPTNEELEIANQCYQYTQKTAKTSIVT